jgi:anthranilate synthase component I
MLAELAQTTTLSPIVREFPADLETPTSVYLKLRGGGPSFLLESVEGGERIARYSFIGVEPRCQYVLRGRTLECRSASGVGTITLAAGEDPLQCLESELAAYSPRGNGAQDKTGQKGLPRFIGGLVGFLGYETVRYFEPKLDARLGQASTPDAIFLLTDTVVAFDHVRRSLFLITHPFDGEEAAQRKLDALEARLRAPLPAQEAATSQLQPVFQSNRTQSEYEALVLAAKEHIAAGDIFQIQISQRFSRSTTAQPFDIYRAVRRLNPSPYMFYFEFGEIQAGGEPFYLVGASPEMFVRLEGRRASQRPIAGTRPRGQTAEADAALEKELLADPKERAEHVMLVDLARNDLGRVCAYGSVCVPEFFVIERYSHVMHLVSHVEGLLRPGLTAFDLVRASFPAGTVTGAPKVRAMEIIGDLEADTRGPYAGAVGYFGFDGAMDICLAIRTLVGSGQTVSVQAAAGIVADSSPTAEYQETVNKAKAMLKAVELAEKNC